MKIGVPKEVRNGETRVAVSPDSVKKYIGVGLDVLIQSGAGDGASMADEIFETEGATIVSEAKEVYGQADIILKVVAPICEGSPEVNEISMMKPDAILIGMLNPLFAQDQVKAYAKHGLTSFAMELIPRISRAQSMDALSSQSNIAGYKAVLDAANVFGQVLPMMMTAAGTLVPAKVVVMGAGVAGLQAIATAHRLGAVVSAFDVRPAVKEQVESLGASFIDVENKVPDSAETASGYAEEMDADYQDRQATVIAETLEKQDICITTAQIPGKKAPVLITEDMVRNMKNGSVIVDLATETGGNCELSEYDAVVEKHGVTIIGYSNYPARVPADTSVLYARNLYNFIVPMIDAGTAELAIDWEDEIIKGSLLTRGGSVVHEALNKKAA